VAKAQVGEAASWELHDAAYSMTYFRGPSEFSRLRLGFRLRAQTPAERLNFDTRGQAASVELPDTTFMPDIFSGSFDSTSLLTSRGVAQDDTEDTWYLRNQRRPMLERLPLVIII
jgi:hypothetical protein